MPPKKYEAATPIDKRNFDQVCKMCCRGEWKFSLGRKGCVGRGKLDSRLCWIKVTRQTIRFGKMENRLRRQKEWNQLLGNFVVLVKFLWAEITEKKKNTINLILKFCVGQIFK